MRSPPVTRLLAMLLLVAMVAVSAPALADPAADRTSVFRVEGMTCGLCAKAIDKALREVEGVRSVQVDREREEVAVVVEGDLAWERLEQAIEGAGPYRAELVP